MCHDKDVIIDDSSIIWPLFLLDNKPITPYNLLSDKSSQNYIARCLRDYVVETKILLEIDKLSEGSRCRKCGMYISCSISYRDKT